MTRISATKIKAARPPVNQLPFSSSKSSKSSTFCISPLSPHSQRLMSQATMVKQNLICSSLLLHRLHLRFEHHRRRTGDAAILAYAPEVDGHEDGGDERDADAMPDVGTQERVRIHD